jgi:sugar phosphate isomerase/epimerase
MNDRSEYHVFSKMFQPPATTGPEALCDLLAASGCDGVQWTVRPGGHVEPSRAKDDLPRLAKIAASRGLKCRTICTAIADPAAPDAEELLRVAADCGVELFRPAYLLYDEPRETAHESLERFRRAFAAFAALGARTGVKASYQNHSPWWGPRVFGTLSWDLWECLRDLDPATVGIEFDPMYAYFETGLAWRHGFELVAPWIAALDLKDFRYRPPRAPGRPYEIEMVPAGEGVVPWDELRALVAAHAPRVPRILHFEWPLDSDGLGRCVRSELAFFQEKLA